MYNVNEMAIVENIWRSHLCDVNMKGTECLLTFARRNFKQIKPQNIAVDPKIPAVS